MGQGENYPHIQRYVAGLSQLPSWQAAVQIEQNGVKSRNSRMIFKGNWLCCANLSVKGFSAI